jgi:transposase-like protein
MNTCPYCQSESGQQKNGRTGSGSQQYWCKTCGRRYTPEPKQAGYPDAVRLQAVRMAADGLSLRQIGRHLGVVHRTVGLWVQAHAAQLPAAEQPPQPIAVSEQDELFTFIGSKKSRRT